MSQNIRTKIEFQDWDSLTESTKSLASFFLAHSCLFFRGEYDGDNLSFMSSALFMDNLSGLYFSRYGITESRFTVGSFFGQNRDSYLAENGQYLCKDGIPEVDTTFVNTQSAIEVFSVFNSYYTDYEPTFCYESDERLDYSSDYGLYDLYIPTVFKVIANDVEVEDPYILPTFIKNKGEDANGYHVTQFPIDTSLLPYSYSFNLRTSSFTIKYTNSNNVLVEKDVFYKIGIWTNTERHDYDGTPYTEFDLDSDGHYDIEEVIDYILDPDNNFKFDLYLWEEDKLFYFISNPDNDHPELSFNCGDLYYSRLLVTPSKYDTSVLNQITKAVIFPLCRTSYNLGIIYLKLYNQDGTQFTDMISGSTEIGVKETSSSQAKFNTREVFLSFTNQNMESGFIPSTAILGPEVIIFGSYPQSSSDPEPIEWYVLDVDTVNNKSLVISKRVLDCQKYNTTNTNVTWETCSLRTWLNSDFYNTAFNASEKNRILLSHIDNPDNPDYSTSGGNDTDDFLFCLSLGEAGNTDYFPNDDSRKVHATQYAIDAGASECETGSCWWLRSPGNYYSYYRVNEESYVNDNGHINSSGNFVNISYTGVRPAMWISNS